MASLTNPWRVLFLTLALLLISQALVMPALARPLVAEKKLTEVQSIHILHVTIKSSKEELLLDACAFKRVMWVNDFQKN